MPPSTVPPTAAPLDYRSAAPSTTGLDTTTSREQIIVEAWAQGFNVGALVFIILIVLCNYRKNVLLHKLILIELILAIWHGIFCFFEEPAYGWLLSATAVPLYVSYTLHNVVAWIKIKPFLPLWGGRLFIISLCVVQPYWILEAYANFAYFNDLGHEWFEWTRYFEVLARDPWWIFTTVKLVLVINKNYEYTMPNLIKTSPRFGVMLLCMFVSIVFLVTDLIVTALISVQSGINPFWRLALVFKCASDAIFLDDFKSVLDRIAESALRYVANLPSTSNGGPDGKPHASHASGRRRGSSVGFRRQSAAANRFNAPRHQVHISSDNTNAQDKMSELDDKPKFARDPWAESRYTPRGVEALDEGHNSDGTRQILAETTITISDNDELGKSSSRFSGRSESQERMLSGDLGPNAQAPDYGWGDPPGMNRPRDEESGIPMQPMRARTTNRGVGFAS